MQMYTVKIRKLVFASGERTMNDEVDLDIKVRTHTAHESVEEALHYVNREYVGPLDTARSRTSAFSVEEIQ
jgi:hypothetical protein